MRNVLLNLMAVLLVFSVQGCWAGEVRSDVSKDGKSREFDPIDASKIIKRDDGKLIIDKRSVSNARWCGNEVMIYQVFGGKYDEVSHPIYDQIWWKNIETGKGGMVSDKGGIYACSPDGQWLIFGEKNFTIPESEIHKISSEDVAKKYDIKLKNIVTGQEEILPKGDFYVEKVSNAWSADGNKAFIRGFDQESFEIFRPKISKSLEVHYLPYKNKYMAWLPNSNLIVGSKKGQGFGVWNVSVDGGLFREFIHKTEAAKDLSTKGLSVGYGVFDRNGNWYRHRYSLTQKNSSKENILRCSINDRLLECRELLPEGVLAGAAYSVLPSGEAIHFLGYLGNEKPSRKPIRYSINTGELIDISLHKEKFPISMLIAGKFSRDGKWVLHYNDERLAAVEMANYYMLFGGGK